MFLRHSTLWPVAAAKQDASRAETRAAAMMSKHLPVSDVPLEYRAPSPQEIDAHLQQWADAGWELVNGSTAVAKFGVHWLPTYTFFWRQASAPPG